MLLFLSGERVNSMATLQVNGPKQLEIAASPSATRLLPLSVGQNREFQPNANEFLAQWHLLFCKKLERLEKKEGSAQKVGLSQRGRSQFKFRRAEKRMEEVAKQQALLPLQYTHFHLAGNSRSLVPEFLLW